MIKSKKIMVSLLSCVMTGSFAFGSFFNGYKASAGSSAAVGKNSITNVTGLVKPDTEKNLDSEAVYKVPETVAADDEISVIVEMSTDTVLDSYKQSGSTLELSEYVVSRVEIENYI